MPNYYPYAPQPMPMNYGVGSVYGAVQPSQQYMINVDGEIGARAWQVPGNTVLPPNTVVPLWDFDGVHVYFKSTDAYGRMNPLRKAKVVFEEEETNRIPQNTQVSGSEPPMVNTDHFVTKEDFNELKQEIRSMLNQRNQNGSNVASQSINRGGTK